MGTNGKSPKEKMGANGKLEQAVSASKWEMNSDEMGRVTKRVGASDAVR